MRVLINALSVTNLSGRHVLLGHLQRLAGWTRGEHEFEVLYHTKNKDICGDLGANVRWVECPASTGDWVGRAAFEMRNLDRLATKLGTDFLFTPAGTVIPGIHHPQVVFAQNPWALVNTLDRSLAGSIKAALQRRNYASAVKKAKLMFFNSKYMRDAYRENAGAVERASEIVYQGVDDATYERAVRVPPTAYREPMQILCVSAMARHKGVETLVESLGILHQRYELPARLVLVGSWPDSAYERKIRILIESLRLAPSVSIRGHVDRSELESLYAESRIFALMSRCESFGIPAIEAQVFGTPVVSSDCCAIPEVCGNGGLFPETGNAAATALQIARLLDDDVLWAQLSHNARINASKYRWDACSRPLLRMFEDG